MAEECLSKQVESREKGVMRLKKQTRDGRASPGSSDLSGQDKELKRILHRKRGFKNQGKMGDREVEW